MFPKPLRPILPILVLSVAVSLSAMDRVKIRTNGTPSPSLANDERIKFRVTRTSPGSLDSSAEVDRYFDRVGDILSENRATEDWGFITDPTSWVEIDIIINKHHFILACTYGSEGVALPQNPTPAHKQFAAAFQEILSLTLERLHKPLYTK